MLLIVSKKKSQAQTISEMIRFSGILCYPATPKEALSEISTLYRAVVIIDPDTLPDAADFVKKLRSYLSSIPIFALYNSSDFKASAIFDGSYSAATYSARFAARLASYAKSKGLDHIGDYRLAGINATPDLPSVTFFEVPIKLTRTEAMILRFLMRSYPITQKSKSIIKYVYKASDAPEQSSIRTHICSINKKFKEHIGSNLIRSIDNSGYIIYTPEQKEKYRL